MVISPAAVAADQLCHGLPAGSILFLEKRRTPLKTGLGESDHGCKEETAFESALPAVGMGKMAIDLHGIDLPPDTGNPPDLITSAGHERVVDAVDNILKDLSALLLILQPGHGDDSRGVYRDNGALSPDQECVYLF